MKKNNELTEEDIKKIDERLKKEGTKKPFNFKKAIDKILNKKIRLKDFDGNPDDIKWDFKGKIRE